MWKLLWIPAKVFNIYEYMIGNNESVKLNDNSLLVFHNPVTEEYRYCLYHVLDLYNIDGKTYVNVQYTEYDETKRVDLSYDKFLNLVLNKVLIPMR